MSYTLKSNDLSTIKAFTIGLNKDGIYAFDNGVLSYLADSIVSGEDTIQFVFMRNDNSYHLTFGRKILIIKLMELIYGLNKNHYIYRGFHPCRYFYVIMAKLNSILIIISSGGF